MLHEKLAPITSRDVGGLVTGAFLFPNKLAIYGFLNVWNAKNVTFANIRGINY